MIPLYAVRVEDLKPGDAVIIECGVCSHTAAIPPSGLMHGLPLSVKVLDLAPRLRCRECDAKGSAVVSVK